MEGASLRTWAFIGFLDLKMLKKYYRLETFPIIHHTKVVSQAPRRTIFHSRADRKNHGKTSWVLGEDVLLPGRPPKFLKMPPFQMLGPVSKRKQCRKVLGPYDAPFLHLSFFDAFTHGEGLSAYPFSYKLSSANIPSTTVSF